MSKYLQMYLTKGKNNTLWATLYAIGYNFDPEYLLGMISPGHVEWPTVSFIETIDGLEPIQLSKEQAKMLASISGHLIEEKTYIGYPDKLPNGGDHKLVSYCFFDGPVVMAKLGGTSKDYDALPKS